jgi:hypothetical protein
MPSLISRRHTHLDQIWNDSIRLSLEKFSLLHFTFVIDSVFLVQFILRVCITTGQCLADQLLTGIDLRSPLPALFSFYLTRYSVPCNDIGFYSVDILVQISTGTLANLIKVFRDSLQSLHTIHVTVASNMSRPLPFTCLIIPAFIFRVFLNCVSRISVGSRLNYRWGSKNIMCSISYCDIQIRF